MPVDRTPRPPGLACWAIQEGLGRVLNTCLRALLPCQGCFVVVPSQAILIACWPTRLALLGVGSEDFCGWAGSLSAEATELRMWASQLP